FSDLLELAETALGVAYGAADTVSFGLTSRLASASDREAMSSPNFNRGKVAGQAATGVVMVVSAAGAIRQAPRMLAPAYGAATAGVAVQRTAVTAEATAVAAGQAAGGTLSLAKAAEGVGRGGTKLKPEPAAQGPHTTFKRD